MSPEFIALMESQSGRIYAIARRYADTEQVEDLYQEILEQLWRSYGQFAGDAQISTWVYRVGFNTAMTYIRKVVKDREGKVSLASFSQVSDVPGNRSQGDILEDFISCVGDVDASLLMMYLDGLSGAEMAAILGLKVNAVQVRINRLKQFFTERYVEEETCNLKN